MLLKSIFIVIICIYLTSASDPHLSTNEIIGLEYLYNSTNGSYWDWKNVSTTGAIWNFTKTISNDISSYIYDPCIEHWQGLVCSQACYNTTVSDSNVNDCHVMQISLHSYEMAGTIPSQLTMLQNLSFIDVRFNSITGSIPENIGELVNMTYFNIEFNEFSGSLPDSIDQMLNLDSFILYTNKLTGTIPEYVGTLTKLTYLDLGYNKMVGTMPSNIGDLSELVTYYADGNFYSGSIPSSIAQCTKLKLLQIAINQFTSTIPSEYGLLTELYVFNVNSNLFTGSVPVDVMSLPNVRLFDISQNYFTGAVEVVEETVNNSTVVKYGSSEHLYFFYLDWNELSGAFPFEMLCQAGNLSIFNIRHNQLSGTLPSCLGNSNTKLLVFNINSNRVSGTVPDTYNHFPMLETLILSSNLLHGSLQNKLTTSSSGSSNSTPYRTLDISDNGFSGSFPFELFRLDNGYLDTFIGSKNCFTNARNDLSDDLCEATNLQTLALSGLTAGVSCTHTFTMFGLDIYSASAVHGTIPACLFNSTNLVQLFISGNGLVGSVAELSPASSLVNLSLSHNRLTGSIPASIQTTGQFQSLDLSFNRFKGTIVDMDGHVVNINSTNGTSITLNSNRLTGPIPSSFIDTTAAISILDGNIFSCGLWSHILPRTDPDHGKYICSSYELDMFVYSWLIIMGAIIWYGVYRVVTKGFVLGYTTVRDSIASNKILKLSIQYLFWKDNFTTGHESMDRMATSLGQYRRSSCYLLCVILLWFLPLYAILKRVNNRVYTTHTYQYGWFASLGFMEGGVPALLTGGSWLIFILWFLIYEYKTVDRVVTADGNGTPEEGIGAESSLVETTTTCSSSNSNSSGTPTGQSHGTDKRELRNFVQTMCIKASLFMINLVVVLVANGVYVYVILSGDFLQQLVAAGCLISFKLIWNNAFVIPSLNRMKSKFYVLLLFLVFNNVVAPILATVAVDISCFESLFHNPKPIVATYTLHECALYTVTHCDATTAVDTSISFSSPFLYSEQCSSAILTKYAPIYIGIYGVVGLTVCAVQMGVMLTFRHIKSPSKASKPIDQSYTTAFLTEKMVHFKQYIQVYSLCSNGILCDMVFPIESLRDLVRVVPVPKGRWDTLGDPERNSYQGRDSNFKVAERAISKGDGGMKSARSTSNSLIARHKMEEHIRKANKYLQKRIPAYVPTSSESMSVSIVEGSGVDAVVLRGSGAISAPQQVESTLDTEESSTGVSLGQGEGGDQNELQPDQDSQMRDSVSIRDSGGNMRVCKLQFYRSRGMALNSAVVLTLMLTFGLAYPPLAVVLALYIVASTLVLQLCVHEHRVQIVNLNNPKIEYLWSEILSFEIRDVHKIVFGSRTLMVVCSSLYMFIFLLDMAYNLNSIVLYCLLLFMFCLVLSVVQFIKFIRANYPLTKHMWGIICELCVHKVVTKGDEKQLESVIEMKTICLPGTVPYPGLKDLSHRRKDKTISEAECDDSLQDAEVNDDDEDIVLDYENQSQGNTMNPLLAFAGI